MIALQPWVLSQLLVWQHGICKQHLLLLVPAVVLSEQIKLLCTSYAEYFDSDLCSSADRSLGPMFFGCGTVASPEDVILYSPYLGRVTARLRMSISSCFERLFA